MSAATADLIVYGNTWAAVHASCAAAEQGIKVIMLFPQRHVGGIISQGLGAVDYGAYATRNAMSSWLAADFFARNGRYHGGYRGKAVRTHPGATERMFCDMLGFYGVWVLPQTELSSLMKIGATATGVADTAGNSYTATQFIDASDDGDLMKLWGCSSTYGCEAQSTYGESLAGFQPSTNVIAVNAYDDDGVLLPGVNPYPAYTRGAATPYTQTMTFRVCVTTDPRNKRQWRAPPSPNTKLFELRRRLAALSSPNYLPFTRGVCWGDKFDVNGDFGTGRHFAWPTMTWAQRQDFTASLRAEQQGWFYFLATDPSVHANARAYMNGMGLPLDEFADNAGWPNEPYIRESNRLVGQYVLRQADITTSVNDKADSISVGYYNIDSHPHQALAVDGGIVWEGMIGAYEQYGGLPSVQPYQIPFRCIRPLNTEATNLMVTNAASVSHVAHSSYRIDLHKANVGTAAGYIAARAIQTATALDSLDITAVQAYLTGRGHVIQYTPPT